MKLKRLNDSQSFRATFLIGCFLILICIVWLATGCGDDNPTNPVIIVPSPKPVSVSLDSIIVVQIPFENDEGICWDLFSGADLFFNFTNSAGVILLRSEIIYDLSRSDLPVIFWTDPPYIINNWNTTYFFKLYDWDALSNNDYIGKVYFCINQVIENQGYSERLIIRNQSQTIRLRLALRWVWS